MGRRVAIVDTTIRDGQMSLWATGMRTGMILPVAEALDGAGFQAIELMAAAFFKKLVRDLREDPWERIRAVARRVTRTPLRVIRNRHISSFQLTPASVSNLWMERLAANGVREIRLSDPSNTPSFWRPRVEAARNAGLDVVLNLIFSVSPKHTDAYYAERARSAAQLDVQAICLKDPSGLLTPDRVRSLVPVIREAIGSIPLEFHSHCNTGLGPLCALEAIRLGVPIVDVAIPPLSDGASLPSVFDVTANARRMGYEVALDEERLRRIERHFTFIARREGLPIGAPARYDAYHYTHQIPGGMISNLRFQLGKLGREERLPEVLEEVARVRADLGYPIMVTPYSQFVGTQAVMNVIAGERYRQVTDEVIQYALGHWGEEERAAIDPEVRDRILDRPRARELAAWEPEEPSLREVRARFGGPSLSDDELLLRYMAGEREVAVLRSAGPSEWEERYAFAGAHPVLALIEGLSHLEGCRAIRIEKGTFSLRLERG